MKPIGYARLDSLGRLLVPRGVRYICDFESRDNLLVSIEGKRSLKLTRISPYEGLLKILRSYTESIYDILGLNMCLTDKYTVITTVGPDFAAMAGERLTSEARKLIADRTSLAVSKSGPNHVQLIREKKPLPYKAYVLTPIVFGSNTIGAVIAFLHDTTSAADLLLAENASKVAAAFVSNIVGQN